MVEWVKEGSLAWVILNNRNFHFPRRSDWRVASTTGWDGSVGTPDLKLALDLTQIQIPILRYDKETIVETQILKGYGVGFSAGVNLQVPFVNFARSKSEDPGVGSPIYESPFCPEPLDAKHLAGMCLALSGNAVALGQGTGGRQGSATTLVFGDELGFNSLLPTSINAVAFVVGSGTAWGTFAGAGVEVILYKLTMEPFTNSIGDSK